MGEEQTVQTDEEIVAATGISDIYAAAKRLEGIVRKTPLVYSEFFSELSDNATYLKLENLQTTGAFKLRGAYNRISMLTEEEKARGVITASAGNHAQGVAYASQKLGVNAIICMPATTPILKVEATRALGATVILHGNGFDDAYAHSLELQKEKGFVYIHPFNDRDVLVGQGTIALEVIDALKDVDAILVPVGGGGLASGIALAVKLVNPQVVLSLAALQKLRMKDKKIAVLISGGNIDISTISALISKALISRGRVFRFSVQLPDKPGQLLTVAQILTEQDANVIRLDHDQTMVTDSFQKVQLTVTVEAHGQEHIDRIVAALASNGFEINKIY